MLDLEKLKDKLDKALDKETRESLIEWIKEKKYKGGDDFFLERKATKEEVIAAFEKECIRRYGENWKTCKLKKDISNDEAVTDSNLFNNNNEPLNYATNFNMPLLIHIVVCSTGK